MKYLPKFKWDHLTGGQQGQRRSSSSRAVGRAMRGLLAGAQLALRMPHTEAPYVP